MVDSGTVSKDVQELFASKKKGFIYLDHAATTPMDKRVKESMLPYFDEDFMNWDNTPKTLWTMRGNALLAI